MGATHPGALHPRNPLCDQRPPPFLACLIRTTSPPAHFTVLRLRPAGSYSRSLPSANAPTHRRDAPSALPDALPHLLTPEISTPLSSSQLLPDRVPLAPASASVPLPIRRDPRPDFQSTCVAQRKLTAGHYYFSPRILRATTASSSELRRCRTISTDQQAAIPPSHTRRAVTEPVSSPYSTHLHFTDRQEEEPTSKSRLSKRDSQDAQLMETS